MQGLRRGVRIDELAAYSLVRASAARECTVRARSLDMAACLVYGAMRSRGVLSAAGCPVYAGIETRAPNFTRVCVRYGVRHMQRMFVCLMLGVGRTRATYRGGVCG